MLRHCFLSAFLNYHIESEVCRFQVTIKLLTGECNMGEINSFIKVAHLHKNCLGVFGRTIDLHLQAHFFINLGLSVIGEKSP